MASRAGSLGHSSIWPWLLPLNTGVTAAKFLTPLRANVTEKQWDIAVLHACCIWLVCLQEN